MKVRSFAVIGCVSGLKLSMVYEFLRGSEPGSADESRLAAECARERNRRWQKRRGWLSRMGVTDGQMNGGAR